MRLNKSILCTAALCLLAGCAKVEPKDQFTSKQLSIDDIVSAYDIDLKSRQCERFEWSFAAPQYVRCIIEKSEDEGKTWTTYSKTTGTGKTSHATFLFIITPVRKGEGGHILLEARVGAITPTSEYWSGSKFEIPIPPIEYTAAISRSRPEEVISFKSHAGWYRVKIQRANSRFDPVIH